MFFDDNNKKENKRGWLSIPIAILLSLLLIFLARIGWLNTFKNGISYALDPIYTTSSNLANDLKNFFSTLTNISEFREEYNELKIKIAEYDIQNAEFEKLKKENIDLKTQLDFANKEDKYIQAEVLNRIDSDYLTVNVGKKDDVQEGDIAVLGDYFVGIVIDSTQYSSKIRLPISKSNFLEAYVISSNQDYKQRILSRAVVNGSSDGIKIENIGMNSGVENGDVVIVNDNKVGENLVLGNIVGLSEDPAKTTRTGYVSPIVDYYDLINVFIIVKNAD